MSNHESWASGLHSLAGGLRNTTRNLERDGVRGPIAALVDRAADRIDSMSTYVRSADSHTMLRDAARLARRRPELMLAGGFVTGLLVGHYF